MRIAVAGATGLVGKQLVAAADDAGHDVVELSRACRVDLTDGSSLDLTGVDAVIDVTNSPGTEESVATDFFVAAARTLGAAATAAGARRTVVLSIIGVDLTPDDGYYVAKLAHERATVEFAPAGAAAEVSPRAPAHVRCRASATPPEGRRGSPATIASRQCDRDRAHGRQPQRGVQVRQLVGIKLYSDGIQLGVTNRQNASVFLLGHVDAIAAVLTAAAQPD